MENSTVGSAIPAHHDFITKTRYFSYMQEKIKDAGHTLEYLPAYTQTISKVGFGQRESFRNSSILSGLILEI